ncbi:sensor histidine kinase [Paraburkholderia sediminicola]|uniref:sensor histidine kinase n=1 Tax=Paraburkholderia sediminicola TaxID=458836 RepID=UPI0038B8FA3B
MYPLAWHRANVQLDHHLHQVVDHVLLRGQANLTDLFIAPATHSGDDLVVEVWKNGNDSGHPDWTNSPNLIIPRTLGGVTEATVAGQTWRVYRESSPQLDVLAAQRTRVINVEVERTGFDSLLPTLVLLPLMWLITGYCVRRALKPLDTIGAQVGSSELKEPLSIDDSEVPIELVPFVSSINTLLERLARYVEVERTFVAEAAHELRTPIFVLQVLAHNLRNAKSDSEARERHEELDRGIKRIVLLVRQLLGLAKAEGMGGQSAFCLVDLLQLVRTAIADSQQVMLLRGVDIGLYALPELAYVYGNEGELHAVLKNLIENAIHYSPHGACIDIRIVIDGPEIVVEVQDNGPGIPEDMLDKVFERFFRIRNNDVEGSGLGLAIVQTIVAKHGGMVRLQNLPRPEHGIVAQVRLPLAQAPVSGELQQVQ